MPYKRIMQAGIMLAGALLLVTATLKSQAPARSAQVWEYSSVSGSPYTNSKTELDSSGWESKAEICYATAQGCRREEIAKTVSNQADGGEAMMIAAAKLGEQGWELTTSTAVTGKYDGTGHSLYFRRLKSEPK